MKRRLDRSLTERGFVATRSQAMSYIKLGQVTVNNVVVSKAGYLVGEQDVVVLKATEQYVSRAGLKLASVAKLLKLDFKDKVVLDIGSSTGGFTDYALRHGAKRVIAVELGTDQMHPSLRVDPLIELHEKTDILTFTTNEHIDVLVADVSFISLRAILPQVSNLMAANSLLVAMVKPQFEARESSIKHHGVIKNDKMRREILKDFEAWAQKLFIIINKADSAVAGAKGNQERFYLMRKCP